MCVAMVLIHFSLFAFFFALHFDFSFFVCSEYVKYHFGMMYRLLECWKYFRDWTHGVCACVCVVVLVHLFGFGFDLVWWFTIGSWWQTECEKMASNAKGMCDIHRDNGECIESDQQNIETERENQKKKTGKFASLCDDDLCAHRRMMERIQHLNVDDEKKTSHKWQEQRIERHSRAETKKTPSYKQLSFSSCLSVVRA